MKPKKLMALLLAGAMLIGGCGTQTDQDTGSGSQSSDSAATPSETGETSASGLDMSETLTYSVFIQADDVPDPQGAYENSAVVNYWQDMFNIKMEWQLPPQGSESDQFTLMIGTGDYTDIMDMSFNTENLSTLCDDGVIYDLTPYIEEYMPNYYTYLQENDDVRTALYDDDGQIYTLAVIQENPKQWGGLVYRKDILDTMTDGNIQFPSGNDEPTTIDDWDYMLDLMNQYFQASGMADYAGLILPACGYFQTGELMAGFGIGGVDYIDEDGKVAFGIAEDNFYNYLTKMNEWYEKGYIYRDFASRSQDLFYLPNTALTYGGAAGVFYGLTQQLGDAMSVPDYDLYMDVQPINAPADTEHGIETPLGLYLDSGRASTNSGFAISTACSEEKLYRILTAIDYFYSDEGAATRSMGLSSEQGAANYPEYEENGCPNGARISGTTQWTEEMDNKSDANEYLFSMDRLPGISVDYPTRTCDLSDDGQDYSVLGDEEWTKYGNANVYPLAVSLTPEESDRVNTLQTSIIDYADSAIVNFIMGETELTEESFKAYQDQLESLGLSEYLEIKQAAYDRYMSRGE